MKKIFFSFLLVFFLLFAKEANAYTLNSQTDQVYLGGETVGLKLNTGVKVLKTFAIVDGPHLLKPWEDAGIQEEDIICSYNGVSINCTDDLLTAIHNNKDKMVPLTIIRADKEIQTKINETVRVCLETIKAHDFAWQKHFKTVIEDVNKTQEELRNAAQGAPKN